MLIGFVGDTHGWVFHALDAAVMHLGVQLAQERLGLTRVLTAGGQARCA